MYLRTLEICILKYTNLIPQKFLSTPGLDLLADINMLIMVEKGSRGGICHSIYRYTKANNKYRKDHDKNKELPHIQCCDVNNLYGWAMSQELPVKRFEWIKGTSQFNEDFIKNYNVEREEGYLFQVDVQILKKYINFIMIYHFYQKEWKLKKSESL